MIDDPLGPVFIDTSELSFVDRLRKLAVEITGYEPSAEFALLNLDPTAFEDDEMRPQLLVQFDFDPPRQSELLVHGFSVALIVQVEVCDGGPSRIKAVTSDRIQPGVVTLQKQAADRVLQISRIDELHHLEPGSMTIIEAAITGVKDELMIDLTPRDRAIIKPALITLYGPSAIETTLKKPDPPRFPTLGM